MNARSLPPKSVSCAGGHGMRVWFEGGWDAGLVRVLEWDRELLRGTDPVLAARAARGVVVQATSVAAAGPVEFQGIPADAFGVLVLDGLLMRRVEMVGRASGELLGAGDLLRPWQDDGPSSTMPAETYWRALRPTRLALLD